MAVGMNSIFSYAAVKNPGENVNTLRLYFDGYIIYLPLEGIYAFLFTFPAFLLLSVGFANFSTRLEMLQKLDPANYARAIPPLPVIEPLAAAWAHASMGGLVSENDFETWLHGGDDADRGSGDGPCAKVTADEDDAVQRAPADDAEYLFGELGIISSGSYRAATNDVGRRLSINTLFQKKPHDFYTELVVPSRDAETRFGSTTKVPYTTGRASPSGSTDSGRDSLDGTPGPGSPEQGGGNENEPARTSARSQDSAAPVQTVIDFSVVVPADPFEAEKGPDMASQRPQTRSLSDGCIMLAGETMTDETPAEPGTNSEPEDPDSPDRRQSEQSAAPSNAERPVHTVQSEEEFLKQVYELHRRMLFWRRLSFTLASLLILGGWLITLIFMGSVERPEQERWLKGCMEFIFLSAIVTAPIILLIRAFRRQYRVRQLRKKHTEEEWMDLVRATRKKAKISLAAMTLGMLQMEIGRALRMNFDLFLV
jgi:hypothetical protein